MNSSLKLLLEDTSNGRVLFKRGQPEYMILIRKILDALVEEVSSPSTPAYEFQGEEGSVIHEVKLILSPNYPLGGICNEDRDKMMGNFLNDILFPSYYLGPNWLPVDCTTWKNLVFAGTNYLHTNITMTFYAKENYAKS
jgi:hypothetical protein